MNADVIGHLPNVALEMYKFDRVFERRRFCSLMKLLAVIGVDRIFPCLIKLA